MTGLALGFEEANVMLSPHIPKVLLDIWKNILEAGVTSEWLKGIQKVASDNLPPSL